MNATITGVVYDALPDAPPQTAGKSLATPAGETGAVAIVVRRRDGSPYDLTGCQLLLTVSNPPSSVLISRQATLDTPAAGLAHWPLVVADTVGKSGAYAYDVWLTDAIGDRYQVDAVGTFVVTSALGQPNQAVTAPVSQQPLAQGPQGPAGATGAQGPKGDKGDPGDGGAAAFSVLYCAAGGQHINHGLFWKNGQLLAAAGCVWEAWFMGDPLDESSYIISDGYGGSHALLWSGASGNVSFRDGGDVDQIVSYTSLSLPPPNVFSHCMVQVITDAWGNQFIETVINGISTSKTPVPAGYTRAVSSGASGQGVLFVMGSDHSNAKGWIAGIRGWDTMPRGAGAPGLGDVFIPQRTFTSISRDSQPSAYIPADFCASYVGQPGVTLWPDLGRGYDSNGGFAVRSQHHGYAAGNGDTSGDGRYYSPLPQAVAVPAPTTQAPFYPGYVETPPDRGYSPIAPPMGAKRYDSFSRPDQTYAHVSLPDVGSTESGSLGAAAWQSSIIAGGQAFARQLQLFDRSLRSGDQAAVLAYVPNASDSADHLVTITRVSPGSGTGNDGTCGVACRVAADGSSCFYAYYQHIPGIDNTVYLYRLNAANNSTLVAAAAVAQTGWSQLKIQATGTTITVLTDATVVITATDANLAGQKGAGVAFPGIPSSTHYAVTDFAVF